MRDTEERRKIDREMLLLLARRTRLYRDLDFEDIKSERATDWEASLVEWAAEAGLEVDDLRSWFLHTESLCRSVVSEPCQVSYLGPIYSYSYLAAAQYFGLGARLVPAANIAAAFDALARGHVRYCVVPIENNTDGRVVDTLGMLAKTPVKICGEILFPIHHCLLGKGSRETILEVQSKPQALSQCRTWLTNNLPDARVVEVSSTAAAAIAAASDASIAAIASREAGIHNGVDVIAANIEDNQGNLTRFAVIGHEEPPPTGADKTSLMVQLHHKPGALAAAMQVFQAAELNLTWIESFPIPNCPNEYLFFVELDGHLQQAPVASAIEQLRKQTLRFEVLGSYPKGKPS